MLERMLRAKLMTRASKNQNFMEDVYINEVIKQGEWSQLIVDSRLVQAQDIPFALIIWYLVKTIYLS